MTPTWGPRPPNLNLIERSFFVLNQDNKDGELFFQKARKALESARKILEDDPENAGDEIGRHIRQTEPAGDTGHEKPGNQRDRRGKKHIHGKNTSILIMQQAL